MHHLLTRVRSYAVSPSICSCILIRSNFRRSKQRIDLHHTSIARVSQGRERSALAVYHIPIFHLGLTATITGSFLEVSVRIQLPARSCLLTLLGSTESDGKNISVFGCTPHRWMSDWRCLERTTTTTVPLGIADRQKRVNTPHFHLCHAM